MSVSEDPQKETTTDLDQSGEDEENDLIGEFRQLDREQRAEVISAARSLLDRGED